jgi:hypothetical protein
MLSCGFISAPGPSRSLDTDRQSTKDFVAQQTEEEEDALPVVLIDHDQDDLGLHQRQILADAVPRPFTERCVSAQKNSVGSRIVCVVCVLCVCVCAVCVRAWVCVCVRVCVCVSYL